MDQSADIAAELQRTLEQAFSSYREGRLADAATGCREVLSLLPNEPNALHLLGIVHLMNGEAGEASSALAAAAQCQPDNAEIHNSLGAAFRAAGRLDDAEASYRRAIKLNPGALQGYFNLGNTLVDARRFDDAENCYRTVLSVDPHHVESLVALGALSERREDGDAAIEWYGKAIECNSAVAEPHRRLATLLADRKDWDRALVHFDAAIGIDPGFAGTHAAKGVALTRMGRIDNAMESFQIALELEPRSPEALGNFASALCECGDAAASLEHFEKALHVDPANADIHANYANALAATGRAEDAFLHYDLAMALDSRHADARSSKASTLKGMGRLTQALELYDATLDIAPDHAAAHYGRSHVLLSLGRFAEGWSDYRWRPSMREADAAIRREPLGDDLAGKNILVVADQGLGDELFFLRFVPFLRERGAKLTYRADTRLNRMIQRADLFDRVVETHLEFGDFDRVVSIGDLPWLLAGDAARTTPPPPEIPALPVRVREMSSRLQAAGPPPYIGLTWRAGTPGVSGALSKEAPLADIVEAIGELRATIVVVQREPEERELAVLSSTMKQTPLDLSAFNVDLEEMLALMSLLDDYVAVSNTNVHLRASSGRTSRVLVPLPGEFRWMAEGPNSPWFEGTAVYRETAADGWAAAIEALRRDLNDGQA